MHCEIQDPKSRNCNREFVDNEFDTRMRKVLKRIVHLSSRVPSNQLLCQSKTENGIRVGVKSFLLCHIGPHILCRTGPLWCCAAERRNNICGPMWHNKKDFTLVKKTCQNTMIWCKNHNQFNFTIFLPKKSLNPKPHWIVDEKVVFEKNHYIKSLKFK